MYITKITLDRVRCFEHIEFDLSSGRNVQKWGVILGDNSVGKTTLLRSIAMGLCDKTGAAGLLQDTYGDWIRKTKRSRKKDATIKIDLVEGRNTYWIKTTIYRSDAGIETVKQETFPTTKFPWEKIFVCGYGANRSIEGGTFHEVYSTADALYTLFNYDYPLQGPELMLRRIARTKKQIDEICAWIDEVLMLDKESTKLDDAGIKIKGKWGSDVHLGSLADGHVAMITLVLDMLGWALLKRLKKQKNKLHGIVLIDEIEQHLHPSWQKYIIKLLNKVFPELQFIVTTHSPLCAIGTANLPEPDKVCTLILLSQEADHVVARDKIVPPRGKRADQVLTSYLFDLATTRSDGTLQQIERYSALLAKDKRSQKEKSELVDLRKKLNEELGSAETPLQQLVGEAVHKALDKLVAETVKAKKLPKEAIDFEIRRQLNELFSKGSYDKD